MVTGIVALAKHLLGYFWSYIFYFWMHWCLHLCTLAFSWTGRCTAFGSFFPSAPGAWIRSSSLFYLLTDFLQLSYGHSPKRPLRWLDGNQRKTRQQAESCLSILVLDSWILHLCNLYLFSLSTSRCIILLLMLWLILNWRLQMVSSPVWCLSTAVHCARNRYHQPSILCNPTPCYISGFTLVQRLSAE